MSSIGERLRRWPLWLSLVLVLPVGGLAIAGQFDGLYGQDPYAYYAYGTGPLRASLLAGQLWPPPPFFWPPGYPFLISVTSLVLGLTPLTGQLISLGAGGLIPIFTALLARELFAEDGSSQNFTTIALLSGLVAALVPQLWQSSAVVMADTVGLASATAGAWALACYGRRRQGWWLALASGAFAWAILTRWIYGLVAIPAVAYAFVILGRELFARRWQAAMDALVATVVAGLVLSPLLAARLTPASSAFIGDLEVYRWSPLTAFEREHQTVDGRLSYSLPNGLYYALAPAHRYYLTPMLAVLILPGLWLVMSRRHLLRWCVLAAWPLLVYGFHAGAPWQNFRFTLAYLPPLAILTAVGFDLIWQRLSPRWRWGLWMWLGVGLLSLVWGGLQLTQSFITRKANDLARVEAVELKLPPGARLLTFTLTLTFQHYSDLETLELFDVTPGALPGLLADGRPTFLLLDVPQVETQWQGQPLEASYHWLRDERGLASLGQFEGYTLFQVAGP